MGKADQVKDEITWLGWGEGLGGKYLFLEDVAVAVRHPDGSFTINREPFPKLIQSTLAEASARTSSSELAWILSRGADRRSPRA
jgi:hypothetical protein